MSKLDEVMLKHIESIMTHEHRPFSYLDFHRFKVDGQEYHMSHGTFRNKISVMIKRGEVELVRYSPQGFYTLKGANFTKMISDNHTGVAVQSPFSTPSLSSNLRYLKNHPLYRLIQNIPFDNSALHDIRLRLTVQGIWAILSTSNAIDPVSKDIRLISQEINDLDIKVTVHHTDTVSVIIGCSYTPVAIDTAGVKRLSSSLMLIHDRLSTAIKDSATVANIPNHMDWIVTMWHFGADASVEYKGEMFHASWKVGENAIIALYSKQWKDGKCRIRKELQEYSNGPLLDAIQEKMEQNHGSWC